jgi:hypothetical protein
LPWAKGLAADLQLVDESLDYVSLLTASAAAGIDHTFLIVAK